MINVVVDEVTRASLLRLVFGNANMDIVAASLSANPFEWPSTKAYIALGGEIVDGVMIDNDVLYAEYLQL